MATEVTIQVNVDSTAAMQQLDALANKFKTLGQTQGGLGASGGMDKVGQGFAKAGQQADQAAKKVEGAGQSLQQASQQADQAGKKAQGAAQGFAKAGQQAEQSGKKAQGAGERVRQAGQEFVQSGQGAGEAADFHEKLQIEITQLADKLGSLVVRLRDENTTIEESDQLLKQFGTSIRNDAGGALKSLTVLIDQGAISWGSFGNEIQDLNNIVNLAESEMDKYGKKLSNARKEISGSEAAQKRIGQAMAGAAREQVRYNKSQDKAGQVAKAYGSAANALQKRIDELTNANKEGSAEYQKRVTQLAKVKAQEKEYANVASKAAKELKEKEATLRKLAAQEKKFAQLQAATNMAVQEVANGNMLATRAIKVRQKEEQALFNAIASGQGNVQQYQKRLRDLQKAQGNTAGTVNLLEKEFKDLFNKLDGVNFSNVTQDQQAVANIASGKVKPALAQLSEEIEKLRRKGESTAGATKLYNNLKKLERQAEHTQQAIAHMGRTQSHASVFMLDASRIIEDSAYGLRGMANNIVPAIQSWGRLSKTAGGAGSAMKGIIASMIGPGGLIVLISIITTMFLKYGDAIQKAISPNYLRHSKKLKEIMDEFKETIKSLNDELDKLGRSGSFTDYQNDLIAALEANEKKFDTWIGWLKEFAHEYALVILDIITGMNTLSKLFGREPFREGLTLEEKKAREITKEAEESVILKVEIDSIKGLEDVKNRLKELKEGDYTIDDLDELNDQLIEARKELIVAEDALNNTAGATHETELWVQALNKEIGLLSDTMSNMTQRVLRDLSEELTSIAIQGNIFKTSDYEIAENRLGAIQSALVEVREEEAALRKARAAAMEAGSEMAMVYYNALQGNLELQEGLNAAMIEARNIRNQEFTETLEDSYFNRQGDIDREKENDRLDFTKDVGGVQYMFDEFSERLGVARAELTAAQVERDRLFGAGEPIPQDLLDHIEFLKEEVARFSGELVKLDLSKLSGANIDDTFLEIMDKYARKIRDIHRESAQGHITEEQLLKKQQDAMREVMRQIEEYGLLQEEVQAAMADGGEAVRVVWEQFFQNLFLGAEGAENAMISLKDTIVENWDDIEEAAKMAVDTISMFQENAHQRALNRIEAEKRAVTDKYAQELDNVRLTDNMRKSIEQRRAREMEGIASKEAALRQKQAQAAKRMAMFNIIIDTASAIMKAYSGTGPILGTVFAQIIAALGAAQLAAVATQPIPSFEEGVTNFTGGLARVHGDELLVNMDRGTNVITNENVERLAQLQSPSSGDGASVSNELLLDISDGLQGLRDDVLDQTDRLERVERVVDIREMDEKLTRYQHEEGR